MRVGHASTRGLAWAQLGCAEAPVDDDQSVERFADPTANYGGGDAGFIDYPTYRHTEERAAAS